MESFAWLGEHERSGEHVDAEVVSSRRHGRGDSVPGITDRTVSGSSKRADRGPEIQKLRSSDPTLTGWKLSDEKRYLDDILPN